MKSKLFPYFLTLLLAATLTGSAQKYDFRQFGPPSLPDRMVYSINQDRSGFLWVGTGKGLFRFDGHVFHQVQFPDSAVIRFATVLHCDRSGDMWVGTSDGTVWLASGSSLINIGGIEAQRINDIREDESGEIYVVTQNNGIYIISRSENNKAIHLAAPEGILLFSLGFTDQGKLLAGSQENLLLLSATDGMLKVDSVIPGIEYTRVSNIVPAIVPGTYYAATEDNGIFYVEEGDSGYYAAPLSDDESLAYLRVQSIYSDRDQNLWVSTYGSGVIKIYPDETGKGILNLRHYTTATGLAGDDVRRVFQDNEGNMWIGLYGGGLNQLVSEAFSSYQPGKTREENNIIFIGTNRVGLIAGTPSGYHIFDLFTGTSTMFEPIQQSSSGVPATSYYTDADGRIFIGTGGAGLLIKSDGEPVRQFFRTADAGENYISGISSKGSNLWLATRNGVLVVDSRSGAVVRKFTTNDKLPHNNINQVFIDREGNSLIATEAINIYRADLDHGIIPGDIEIAGAIRNNIQGFAQTKDGSYWIATLGNGLFYLGDDSVNTLSSYDGMKSNYCYSILSDSESRLWAGHEGGFSRFDPLTGSISVYSTAFAGGGDCNPNAIFESSDGIVFIGTTNGLIVYDRKKDLKGTVTPLNNIISITVDNRVYPWKKTLSLPYSKYVVEIDFVGISLSNPDLVRYRTKLDNYDTDWSNWDDARSVTYRLTDGSYTFSLESLNETGTASVAAGAFELVVRKPFWRRWWFVGSGFIIVAGIAIGIVRIREENQRKMRLHLEKELQERTREVVRQKEEIEQQNIEITDSINYARRIQSSILPDVAKLKESFEDAFIVFIPRDIVSGDFYWFEKLDDDRFILACADSTGHGVPGAFMSMIGSTLLQDIVTRKNVTKPSQILSLLDEQIFSTLNRNIDVGVSNDGMDMVICEFNLRNRHVRFASAMRPVVLIMEGEPVYIKGNRSSVGGMAYTEKFFDDQEYYLSEGDSLYLFSDGFPDQFGGINGKKMKVARLKKLIEELGDMSMDEQKEYITNFFYEWKGDNEQVDDILFMGIRF